MITTEKAFDLLPYVADIFEKLELESVLDEKRKQAQKKQGKTEEKQRELGLSLIMHIVKNSQKCKGSFFPMLAILCDCTEEEAKQKPVPETITALRELLMDEELMGFFKSAVPQEQQKQ